jgi:hypothetical protein
MGPITGASTRDAIEKDKPISRRHLWETLEVDLERAKASSKPRPCTVTHFPLPWVLRFGVKSSGYTAHCIAPALRYPKMRFTIAELPAVRPLTQAYVAECGLQDRIDTIAFDMFAGGWPNRPRCSIL